VTHGLVSLQQGIATLKGGTVSVLGDTGVYKEYTRYTILTADKVDGTFKGVETNLAFLAPSLSYDDKNAFLSLTRNGRPYTEVAQTQNQQQIARLFDKAQQDQDKLPAMDILDSLSLAGARRAYEQLNGSINTTVPAAGLASFNRYMKVMKQRMQPLVTGSPSLSVADMSVLMSSRADMGSATGNTLLGALDAAHADRPTPSWGFFGRAYGGGEALRRDDISSRYDQATTGVVLGFDQLVTPSLLVGATMGHSYGTLGMTDLADTAAVKGYQASLYGVYNHGAAYITGILGYGHSDHETRREVPSFAIDRIAQASYAGHLVGGYAEAGYKLPLRHLDIIPLGAIQGGYLRRDGFTEAGGREYRVERGGPGLLFPRLVLGGAFPERLYRG
jgi:fibronectin-binding autotransporter adhesin